MNEDEDLEPHAPFYQVFMPRLEEIHDFLQVSASAIHSATQLGELAEVVASVKGTENKEGVERSREISSKAAAILERDLAPGAKKGIGRFTSLLRPFGLPIDLSTDDRNVLAEFSAVRNLLVHRIGVVDQKFKNDCPWIEVAVGSRLRVSDQMFRKYEVAATNLAVKVLKDYQDLPFFEERS